MGVKSSYVLVHEFGDGIGFHVPPRKNQSEVVYDTSGSNSYIEAVISLLGIDNDQLASMLRDEIRKQENFPGPHRLGSLCKRKMFS